MPAKHAKFSASGSHRWLHCPASIRLSENVPPQPESKYAKEGTDAHHCLEILLSDPKKFIQNQKKLKKEFGTEMVEYAADAAQEIWKRLTPGASLQAETEIDLGFVYPEMFGTCDALIVEEFGRLTVIDFKYGAGIPVDPENNSQLIYYALGAAHKFDFNFTEVCLVIIQPRAIHDRGTVREWVMGIDDLMAWEETFRLGVKGALDEKATANAGDWCRFCPASVNCPALSTQALEDARADFDPIRGTINLPIDLEPDQLARTLRAIDKIEVWIESVRKFAFASLEQGRKVPGFKLVEKRSIRKWTDLEKATQDAKKKFGDKAFSVDLLSPAQLEKTCQAKEWVAQYSSSISSGLTMVPENDKRQAVNQLELDFGGDNSLPKTETPKTLKTKGKAKNG